MRRSKEIMLLLTLLAGAMAFVLWYVVDRRARNRAAPAVAPQAAGPGPLAPTPPVDLTQHDRKTIDFSSGQPVVKDTAADKAALEAGAKDLVDATKGVTFKAAPKPKPAAPPAEPPPAP